MSKLPCGDELEVNSVVRERPWRDGLPAGFG
jgi:hypothetical protein